MDKSCYVFVVDVKTKFLAPPRTGLYFVLPSDLYMQMLNLILIAFLVFLQYITLCNTISVMKMYPPKAPVC